MWIATYVNANYKIIEKLRQVRRNKCATDGDGIAPLDSN